MKQELLYGWESLVGREVVVDTRSSYVVLGVLRGQSEQCMVLEHADLHDLRDTQTNREHYVVHSRRHGIRVNRKRLLLRIGEVVAISLLEDVVEE